MTTLDDGCLIPRLVYCPICKRRPMEIKKVEMGKRNGHKVVQYICSKCGHTLTDNSGADPET